MTNTSELNRENHADSPLANDGRGVCVPYGPLEQQNCESLRNRDEEQRDTVPDWLIERQHCDSPHNCDEERKVVAPSSPLEQQQCDPKHDRDEERKTVVPDWLLERQDYEPLRDRDRFIAKSMLSITGVLAHFRLDDGEPGRLSPSAPTKLLFGLGCILLTSLSTNYFFTLVMLACVLVRLCLLPGRQLRRVAGVAFGAAALTFLLMLPAALLGQQHSSLLIATKVLISVSVAMMVALTTPFNQLTAALRVFHVPNLVILTIDLALKSIVRLGDVALEVLTALRLRSVGRNDRKGDAIGGVGGVVFLKTNEAAQATYDAMACRGFEGEYAPPRERPWRAVDLAWLAAFALLLAAFLYLQGIV